MKPIAVFQLTLEQSPLLNRFMHMHWTGRHVLKKQIALALLKQIGRRSEPLSGRPKLLVTRYSAKQPDQDSAGTKLWLDVLVKLGWLKDDSPDCIEVVSEWCKVPRGQGRVVVHLFSDEQANEELSERMGW